MEEGIHMASPKGFIPMEGLKFKIWTEIVEYDMDFECNKNQRES